MVPAASRDAVRAILTWVNVRPGGTRQTHPPLPNSSTVGCEPTATRGSYVLSPKIQAAPDDAAEKWHAMQADAVAARLDAADGGLTEAEAERRLARYGPNRLPPARRRGPIRRFAAQFDNLLIQVLLVAAAITLALGHWTDAAVILAVCVANAVVGFIQEGKAEQALTAIRSMLSNKATVLRDGRRRTIPAEMLVPGDIAFIEAGDRVPADLRLTRTRNLRTEEAALTGESVAAEKGPGAVAIDAPLGDRASLAFSGTLVVSGQGQGLVVATGPNTEIGRISALIADVEKLETPLLRQMAGFARRLTAIILGLALLVLTYGVLVRGDDLASTFLAVVSLAVAAIPEGLPAILTIALAIGVQRMAGRNAIIRRLPAVETLGSVSIICTDKTGTLTRNEMTVRTVVTTDGCYEIDGEGYVPYGSVTVAGEPVSPATHPLLMEAARVGALCNDAGLRHVADAWVVDGDPMEGALLALGHRCGIDPHAETAARPRLDLVPFDADHRFMATLHDGPERTRIVYVKGAPERILAMSTGQRTEDGDTLPDRTYWHGRIEALAAQGQRVLAVAIQPVDTDRTALDIGDVGPGLVMLGLFGLIDPPREEAVAAVRDCRDAGIRVKMITGDHAATARAIAQHLHLENGTDVLTGSEIEAFDKDALTEAALKVDIFARASPLHKLRLVEALQSRGHVVAMTGDGVNDAPALKRADIGVAMGLKGTEAAKEAAEMVLADDNFASLAEAVRQGRTVYDNLKKAILFLLPVNGGESLGIVIALLLGMTLPITPLQILWVNMVSSIGLALALAFEPTEKDVMSRPPRPMGEPLLSGFLIWRIVFVSMLFVIGIFGMFAWSLSRGLDVAGARTAAVNTLVCLEVFYLFSVRYLRTPSLTFRGIRGTRAVLLAICGVTLLQAVFTYAPFMQRFFETRPLRIEDGLPVIAAGATLFFVLELEKFVRRRMAASSAVTG